MPRTESFDAFYARTVQNVTSQVRALAGGDGAADHAIREAYAHAYQQWYEISGSPDTEGWVLAAARDAYRRRRPEAAHTAAPAPAEAFRPPADALSWPGLYRPLPDTGAAPDAAAGRADARLAGITLPPPPARPGPPRPGGHARPPARRARRGSRARPPLSGRLIALAAAVAVAAAGAAFLATRHPAASPVRHQAARKPARKPGTGLLGAGQSGPRSAIPWSRLTPGTTGWTLAELSAAPAGGTAAGTITVDLVDPRGGRYTDQSWAAGSTPQLLAWSGDHTRALVAVTSAAGTVSYQLLALDSGTRTALQLPAGVAAAGFTRPSGQAILAIRQGRSRYRLQRYSLDGRLQGSVAALPRPAGQPGVLPGCSEGACAVSSPDGLTDAWGVAGGKLQLVSNAGGRATTVSVPGSASCVPVTWRDAATVLAYCPAAGQPAAGRLWLIPARGGAPTPLTASPAGSAGTPIGAWQAAGGTYVTVTSNLQCSGAPAAPRGLSVQQLRSGAAPRPVRISGTTGNHDSVVSAAGGRLLVLAETSCPGTSSLLSVSPSTGAARTVLAGAAGQAGVVAAVPDGNGPVAFGG